MTTSKPSTILATLDATLDDAAAFRLSGPALKAIAETGSESAAVAQAELDRRAAKRKPGSVAERIVAPPVPVPEPAPVVAAVDQSTELAALARDLAYWQRTEADVRLERDEAQRKLLRMADDLAVARSNYHDHIAADVTRERSERIADQRKPLVMLADEYRAKAGLNVDDPAWDVADRIDAVIREVDDGWGIADPAPAKSSALAKSNGKPAPKRSRSRKAVRS